MPFVIITTDKPGAGAVRAALRAAHLDYLTAHQHLLLAAGGLLDDEDKAAGGLLVVDTDDRATAERFLANDPFSLGGLFESTRVIGWRKTFFDRQRIK
ncbi:MAG TPA: YciI family protein [Burkholderiaceae bacterium]|jgi:hypothetical protein